MLFRQILRGRSLISHLRYAQMASDFSTTAGAAASAPTNGNAGAATTRLSINDIPKSWTFTSKLPADPLFPTPADSHRTPRNEILPRQVRGALFTWVRPQPVARPQLLAVSPAAMRDLGIKEGDERTSDFVDTVSGNRIQGWDEEKLEGPGYPWAQCYGGFQFGQWAGQLGDGRAISLFETTNPTTGTRYELQLKGAGLTPYSRFADGKAVLRSSIREFVVSEALHALGVPTTRALSLTLLPEVRVRRETVEPGAIVARFAQSWLRLGTFDILRARGDRDLIRRVATYVAEDVFPGWESLPGRLQDPDKAEGSSTPARGVQADRIEGPDDAAENRFARLYREIVRRNAVTVALWQAYGFMNGVLNTDNTSIFGLSIDYGPFAFMDNFDPAYTPNHDDHTLRYSYRNQPTAIWWNLVRLGEALGELLGAGPRVDEEVFVSEGVKEAEADGIIARAEKLITQAGEEFQAVFLAEYKRAMAARLGLRAVRDGDFEEFFSEALDCMEALGLDFHLFFRRLSALPLADLATEDARRASADRFFYRDDAPTSSRADEQKEEGRRRLGAWLDRWRRRMIEDWGEEGGSAEELSEQQDGERIKAMKSVNPSFVPRGWILDEVIKRIEKDGERDVLDRLMHMSLHPFEDAWAGRTFDGVRYEGDPEEEARWTGDVPKVGRAMQCSCSS